MLQYTRESKSSLQKYSQVNQKLFVVSLFFVGLLSVACTNTAYAATSPTLYGYPTASNPLSSSVILNGNITDDGGASTTVRGFNYGTTASYGSASSTTGTYGVGTYAITLTGLTCNTTYHFQAFTTNSAGTGTSTDQTFTTFTCTNAATHYVDSVNGNDSNSGLNPNIAMKTLAGLVSKYTLTGTNILLARGSVFREQFLVPDKSYIGAYGVGTNPIVSGADLLNNASFTLASGKTYTYQISLPSIPTTNNPYAVVNSNGVLAVWENNVRLGTTASPQTSISGVEATTGSFWWDATNKILYIHTTDSSSPISNGRIYEGSTRTLAIYGGDGFIAEDIIGEKNYIVNTTGQQGYGILGYASGTYRRCVGRYGWNHNVGVANQIAAGTLTFDHCVASDMEVGAGGGGTNFVAYKNGLASAASVIISNSLAQQPAYSSSDTSNMGFYSHGGSVNVVFDTTQSNNNYYGIQLYHDTGSTETMIGNHVMTNCHFGVGSYYTGTMSINNVTAKNCTSAVIVNAVGGTSINNLKSINNSSGVVSSNSSATVITLTNSAIVRDTTPGNENVGTGFSTNNQATVVASGNSYYNLGSPIMYNVTSSDNNNFFGYVRIANNTTFSPGYFFSLSAWRTASGMDAHSTTNNPGYIASFFNASVSDPSISGGDHAPAFLSELTPVTTPSNSTTPAYTFYSTEAGTISYGGDCSSNTTSAANGSNTISFNTLSTGTHSNCTITVNDSAGNASNPLSVSAFTIQVPPTVATPTQTSITSTGATLGANVTSLGIPASISARGTCYGTSPAPTTNCVAEGGTTTGVFTEARTGLSPGTLYYYRGYAINTTGTAYSADDTFTTVAKTTPTLSVTNSPVTYNTSPQVAIVSGSVAGTVSNIQYNASGTVPTNAGTYAITADFAPTDSVNYNPLSGASAGNFTINTATQSTLTVTGLPTSAVYQQAGITAGTSGGLGTGAITFSAGVSTACSIDSSTGALTITAASGSCLITATKAADSNYNSAMSTSVSIAVGTAPQTITVTTAAPGSATYNSTFPVAATASSGLTVAITTTGGCSISGGTITMESGTTSCVVNYDQTGNGSYSAATQVQSTTVATLAAQATLTFTGQTVTSPSTFSALSTTGGSGGGAVTYAVTTAGTAGCSISNTTLSYTTAGTCGVTATKATDSNYNSISSSEATFTINTALSSTKDITAFSFNGLTPAVTATINGTAITTTVPYGTSVTALVATFTTTGASVKIGGATQTSGTTPNDFTNPVTYIVTAADNSTQNYTVTVTIAPIGTHTITASSGANGSITPSGSVSVTNGNDQAFTITPNSGYHIGTVTTDGSSAHATSPYTFTNVTADHTISATFAADPSVTTAGHTSGGSSVSSRISNLMASGNTTLAEQLAQQYGISTPEQEVTNTSAKLNLGTTTLKNGSKGDAVKELQKFLNTDLNIRLKIDGILGKNTVTYIRKWQKAHGLTPDGLVGKETKVRMQGEVK